MHMPIIDLTLSNDAPTLGIVAPEFISTTIDWWTPSKDNGAWADSSVLTANLSSPKLIGAARALSPYFLRIGGSQADMIIYNISTGTNNKDELLDEACRHNLNHCLTQSRWDEVLNFAEATGARLVFTLAYLRNTRLSDDNDSVYYDQQDWDGSNARMLLEYTAKSKHGELGTLYGVELGNELRHKHKATNITRMVAAYDQLRRIVDETWADLNTSTKPKLMGPACTGSNEFSSLIKFIGPHIDIATYHKYHGKGGNPKLASFATSPDFYAHPKSFASQSSAVQKYMIGNNTTINRNNVNSYPSILWVGEGAMAYNSGREGVTNSFISTAWYAAVLSSLSKTQPVSHSVYCRQALIGGYYELISHKTVDPNPDYWMARLWKQLIGRRAIGPIVSNVRKDSLESSKMFAFGCCKAPGQDELLVHAFCSKENDGNAVFVVINVAKSTQFELNITLGTSRTEYILTPKDNQWNARSVMLNGKGPLKVRDDGSLAVSMEGVLRKNFIKTTHVPPKSILFIETHGAVVKQCFEKKPNESSTNTTIKSTMNVNIDNAARNKTKANHRVHKPSAGNISSHNSRMKHESSELDYYSNSLSTHQTQMSLTFSVGFLALFFSTRYFVRRMR
ncbi:hypothetical protein ACHAXN_008548 [Cyclotella atomus]